MKFIVVITFVTLGLVTARPDAPRLVRRPLQPLPQARFTSRLLSRQEQNPTSTGTESRQGYNYPKPEYGAPDQQPPTTEQIEFTTETEAEAIVLPAETGPVVVDEQATLLREALKNKRIIYLGVPERQVEFEEIVYYPTVRETLVEYQPYTSIDTEVVEAIEVLQVPQPAYAYSSQYFERFFKK